MRAQVVVPDTEWYMAGANPQRTSWVSNEVPDKLKIQWYKPFAAYIPNKVQIIATNNTLYISTSKGLYTLNATTGAEGWVFPTDLPLGNSPTVVNNVAYVGGMDKRLYAINATNGTKLWEFVAEAGFDTNPLVINDMVYIGSRDGYMYAIYRNEHPQKGQLAWKYKTGGPIHFSAAANTSGTTIYFASNDDYVYALNASNGSLVWKSAKMPSGGFYSWWPVVAQNMVMLPAVRPYRANTPPTYTAYNSWEPYNIPTRFTDQGNGVMDGTGAMQYLETYPWMRSHYLLNISNGQEVTYDFDGDGKPEYAPLLWAGTKSGSRYPAVIGKDNRVYTYNWYGDVYQNGVAGWNVGTKTIQTRQNFSQPDEPMAYSAGGNYIYWNLCCNRKTGSFHVNGTQGPYMYYFTSDELYNLIPGFNDQFTSGWNDRDGALAVYGGTNGVYGYHGDQNPPIPYNNKIYMHRSNVVIAWSMTDSKTNLGMFNVVTPTPNLLPVDTNFLTQKLNDEVEKIVGTPGGALGPHLKPAMGLLSYFCGEGNYYFDGLCDYWHNTADMVLALSLAYPHLTSGLKTQVQNYLAREMQNFSPCQYTHIGWSEGVNRDHFDYMPEVLAQLPNFPKNSDSTANYPGYRWPPQMFYAFWKYAQTGMANASTLLSSCSSRLQSPPSDAVLTSNPEALNAYIAGYKGYIELAKLAGQSYSSQQTTLNTLLSKRNTLFNKDSPWGPDSNLWSQAFSIARNFMYMTPELGSEMKNNSTLFSKVNAAFREYSHDESYWMAAGFEATYHESVFQPIHDYKALFDVRNFVYGDSREQLYQYLDAPYAAVGDLYYIQNLVAVLEAPSSGSFPTSTITQTPSPSCGVLGDVDCSGQVNSNDVTKVLLKFWQRVSSGTAEDIDGSGQVNVLDFAILLSNFGSSGASALTQSLPSATSSPALTPTSTISPTSTLTPTLTPTSTTGQQEDVTYSFSDMSVAGSYINGVHAGINFGNNAWMFDPSWGGMTSVAYFESGTSKSFVLPANTRLKSIRLSTHNNSGNSSGTYSVSDGVSTTRTGNLQDNQPVTVTTNWTTNAPNITITMSTGSDGVIDDIVYGP